MRKTIAALFVGFYTWIIAVFFGTVLLDIIYSNLLYNFLGTVDTITVFSKVSDFLLLIGAVAILAAIGAISSSWKSKSARNLFIASFLILILEFLIPVFFFQFSHNIQLNIGQLVRIIINGLASILAFIGLYKYYH